MLHFVLGLRVHVAIVIANHVLMNAHTGLILHRHRNSMYLPSFNIPQPTLGPKPWDTKTNNQKNLHPSPNNHKFVTRNRENKTQGGP